jgi:methionyl-tRNA formyltransferase
MRLMMMATGPFAVPTFRALYDTRHKVVALVTAPLRSHREKPIPPISCLREIAAEHGTPILDPEHVNRPESQEPLARLAADLLVVCDYGQILSAATLATCRYGGINLHASLLPKYRGAAPIQWAIYHGETETGVTIIHMTPQLDAGPCVAQERVSIGPEETAAELEPRLAIVGARLVCQTIDAIEAGTVQSLPQDAALASKAPRLEKTDGLIDWSQPAVAIRNHVRAMVPWPTSYTFWHRGGGPPVRLILGPMTVVDGPTGFLPGTVVEAARKRLVIASGQGAVAPASVQPASKRVMSVDEFLRGYPIRPGDRLGGECGAERAEGESRQAE